MKEKRGSEEKAVTRGFSLGAPRKAIRGKKTKQTKSNGIMKPDL